MDSTDKMESRTEELHSQLRPGFELYSFYCHNCWKWFPYITARKGDAEAQFREDLVNHKRTCDVDG